MRTTCAIFSLVLTLAPPAAQQQVAPPRDPGSHPLKGTASITGKVIAADTSRALRRARVTLTGIGLGPEGRRTTSTGLDGMYTFKDLPGARYRVSVERGGYLRLEYGQRRPGQTGRPLEVAAGQTLKQINFALPRMSAISGRVTDEGGEPIEGIGVFAMRQLFYEGQRRLVPVSGAVRTDDEGEFRIQRLAPGTYHVMASTKETWTVIEGGREVVLGYMPTYFPGTGNASDARRVTVGVGDHVRAVDFALVPGRTAKISGTAVDSQGRPFARASLSEEVRGLNFASFGAGPSVTIGGDGAFTAVNVPPGEYMLQASRQAGPEGPPEVALMPIFVDGSGTDMEGLRLTGSSGGTVTGRFISEHGALPETSGLNVSLTEQFRGQPPPAVIGLFRGGTGPVVAEDGTFTVNHVFGRSRFRVTVPEGWMVKRIVQDGRDVMEKVFDLRSGEQIGGIEIYITDRVTEVSGTVLDAKNEPVMEATVLLFPEDGDRWFETSGAMRSVRPDQQGRWSHKGLPPGHYLAIALEYVEEVTWQDPDYLESLRRLCEKVTVMDGGSHVLTLKLRTPN